MLKNFYLFISFLSLLSACQPPVDTSEKSFFSDGSTDEALRNLENNNINNDPTNTVATGTANLVDIKGPEFKLHDRIYLNELFNKIYVRDQNGVVIFPEKKEIITDHLLKNIHLYGGPCDPDEQLVDSESFVTTSKELRNEEQRCHNPALHDPMRRGSSMLRQGWKISLCAEVNKEFNENNPPLSHINHLSGSDAEAISLPAITGNSIKIAYHLFNPFMKIDSELLETLLEINSVPNSELTSDSTATSLQQNRIRWERIFYIICLDPSNEII